MSTLSDIDRIGLQSVIREIEDGKRKTASVSSGYNWIPADTDKDQDVGISSRLASLLEPQGLVAPQFGPWDTGYVGFSDGIAANCNANLTLFSNGAYNFSGHAHVSGAISYDFAFVWAVRDSNGMIYRFGTQGRLHGTFESGSRDYDWGKSEILPALAQGWGAMERGFRWQWDARVNADLGVFLDDITRAVAAGQAIIGVITLIV